MDTSADVVCIYCGRSGGLTNDHVPPKLIFPRPWPNNLVTVPACISCNKAYEKDDQYLRTVLLVRADVAKAPSAAPLVEKLYRSWQRPEGRGFALSILESTYSAEKRSPAGLYLGHAPALQINRKRLKRVMDRVVCGLFFHHRGVRLPDSYIAYSDWVGDAEDVLDLLRASFAGRPVIRIGEAIFAYTWTEAEDDPYVTAWLLGFYDKVLWLGWTLKREDYEFTRKASEG